MIGNVAPTLVGDPDHTVFARVHPMPVRIRPEVAIDAGGMPDFAPTSIVAPGSIRREPAVEIVESNAHADLRACWNCDRCREERRDGDCGRAKRLCRKAKHDFISLVEVRAHRACGKSRKPFPLFGSKSVGDSV